MNKTKLTKNQYTAATLRNVILCWTATLQHSNNITQQSTSILLTRLKKHLAQINTLLQHHATLCLHILQIDMLLQYCTMLFYVNLQHDNKQQSTWFSKKQKLAVAATRGLTCKMVFRLPFHPWYASVISGLYEMVSLLLTRACTVEIIALDCMQQGQCTTATTAPTTVTSKTQAKINITHLIPKWHVIVQHK